MKKKVLVGNSSNQIDSSIRKVISDLSIIVDLPCISSNSALYGFLVAARGILLLSINHVDEVKSLDYEEKSSNV